MGAEFKVKRGVYVDRVVTDGKREGDYIKGWAMLGGWGFPQYTTWHIEGVAPLNQEAVELLRPFDGTIHLSYGEKEEKEMAGYHYSLGTWIRNSWGLWSGGELLEYFKGMGLAQGKYSKTPHADDCSGIILTSFWRHLNGVSLEIKAQVGKYNEWWLRNET